jgi:hypothetical protein
VRDYLDRDFVTFVTNYIKYNRSIEETQFSYLLDVRSGLYREKTPHTSDMGCVGGMPVSSLPPFSSGNGIDG